MAKRHTWYFISSCIFKIHSTLRWKPFNSAKHTAFRGFFSDTQQSTLRIRNLIIFTSSCERIGILQILIQLSHVAATNLQPQSHPNNKYTKLHRSWEQKSCTNFNMEIHLRPLTQFCVNRIAWNNNPNCYLPPSLWHSTLHVHTLEEYYVYYAYTYPYIL